jgi:hypothetical protein
VPPLHPDINQDKWPTLFLSYGVNLPSSLLQTIEADIGSGVLEVTACDWAAIHAEAERLSAKHTAQGGHRGMDIMHVATALMMDATDFLTFDRNQARLANAEGLTVKPG